jgi:uncharacterized protein (DUF1800 family)
MPIPAYAGNFGKAELIHLLRRTMFGVKKADITYFTGKSLPDIVSELLTFSSTPPNPPLVDFTNTTNPDLAGAGNTWVNIRDGNNQSNRMNSLRAWWMGLMLNQDRTIREKMVLFLSNHIPTDIGNTVGEAQHCYQYNALLRQYAVGNFKSFIRAMTLEPAMMYYLNGRQNTRTAPNENYGRELQELFTVGKDLPTYYTEGDVQQAAKALTGWRVGTDANNATTYLKTYFDLSRHDTGNKVFSSFYGGVTITGVNNTTAGDVELDALLNMIFAHPEVARYIVRKLYRFFVYYNIDASIEANVIVPLADTFRSSGYEIKPVLEELFNSQHFFDTALSKGCLIKQPLDFVIGAARTFGLSGTAAPTDIPNTYRNWRFFRDRSNLQTQDPGFPPNVAGWPAYYQKPNYHELWINADTLRRKKEFIDVFITSGSNGMRGDILGFTAALDNPSDPNHLINEVMELLHTLPSDETLKTSLKAILLSNQTSDYYWTDAWNNYTSNPTNSSYLNTVQSRLRTFYTAVLNMAEFNLA